MDKDFLKEIYKVRETFPESTIEETKRNVSL